MIYSVIVAGFKHKASREVYLGVGTCPKCHRYLEGKKSHSHPIKTIAEIIEFGKAKGHPDPPTHIFKNHDNF
jgi:hypothetical protein